MKRSLSLLAAWPVALVGGFAPMVVPPLRAAELAMSPAFRSDIFESPEDGMPESGLFFDNNLNKRRKKQAPVQFLEGDELHKLRRRVMSLRRALDKARFHNDVPQVKRLSQLILAAQQRDAEFVYEVSLERIKAATRAGLVEEAEAYRKEAEVARAALPQFQLEGLWVGKYGDTFQMVNVTYVGDILVAHKVTGDESAQHVPKGEISFQADLSPCRARTSALDPIELAPDAAEQWGSQYLQRHTGLGQVAGTGYVDSQWLEGQLILVSQQYFSFAWMPTGHQVFFGRPSPELTLKLLKRDTTSTAASPHVQKTHSDRQYLERCFEETQHLQDDLEVADNHRLEQHHYYNSPGFFE